MATQIQETETPTADEARLAKESLPRLDHILESGRADFCFRVQVEGRSNSEIRLPASVVRLLKDILTETAQGRAVALQPVRAELTSRQAANALNVSRPYLIGLLESGRIPFRLVGRHRRVRLDDLLAYKRKDDESRRRVADKLTADAQELGMGY